MNIDVAERCVVPLGIRFQIRHKVLGALFVKGLIMKFSDEEQFLIRVVSLTVNNARIVAHCLILDFQHQNPVVLDLSRSGP